MATIQDVAKKANVSISTVSRVINGKTNVTYEKRERVLDAIRETGYIPPVRNESAAPESESAADPQDKGIILVISNVMHKELFSSVREEAEDRGYGVTFLLTETKAYSPTSLRTINALQGAGLLSGIVLINPIYNHPEFYSDPVFHTLPAVQIDSRFSGSDLCYVGNDDYRSGLDITNYLLKHYRRIAYLSSFMEKSPGGLVLSFGNDRQRGFLDAMRAAGWKDEDIIILYPHNTFSGGRDAARDLIAREALPDAVLCATDYIALGLIHEFETNGIHVPDDIGVACISGENEFPDVLHPSLTRVRQSFDDIGHAAINVLDELIAKKISVRRTILVDFQIIPGETTKN